ncbi:hypothetical protein H8356DRAFT_938467 [Neocallimastix lanati (nom. inval.)]|nr:hypothetical protein H8356DRAFT_938467 [Neocallimastix sp. JGI-2020a]
MQIYTKKSKKKKKKKKKKKLFNVYRNGNKNIVKYLIEHGIYIEHEVENDETSLFNAYRSINKNIVKYLIEYGANKNKNKQMVKYQYFKALKMEN